MNAIVEDRFEQALFEAKKADEEIAACTSVEKLALEKPLLGVPMTVKESCSVEGKLYISWEIISYVLLFATKCR